MEEICDYYDEETKTAGSKCNTDNRNASKPRTTTYMTCKHPGFVPTIGTMANPSCQGKLEQCLVSESQN